MITEDDIRTARNRIPEPSRTKARVMIVTHYPRYITYYYREVPSFIPPERIVFRKAIYKDDGGTVFLGWMCGGSIYL